MSARNENGTNVSRGIAAGFLQLADDVVERERAQLRLERRRLLDQLHAGPQQVAVRYPELRRDAPERRVALRVNAGVVERLDGVRHPQEARRLLERLLGEARDLQQRVARLEQPHLRAVLDDRLRQPGPDAGDTPQQVIRGGVHVDADLVHAGVDHLIEALLEARLRTRRAGIARRRCSWDRSSPAPPADPAAGARSRSRRAR